ncbi:acyl carrier protein [Aquimarina sp. RZ0]|uniref:acyl carrier protein n=1 Tax=Aquimarina sp. RZ0 TaxID=2607730 RepID=UPI0011F18BF5|nr:acyl carrier protein [Aquimarina sp. RZ0]KAA1242945.1 acyl carrier protein [Aquimarina sp. RZ0]
MEPFIKNKTLLIELEDWLLDKIAEHLDLTKNDISPHKELSTYGLDSMSAIMISGDIEEKFNIELPSTILWDYPTINDILDYLEDKI